ncbi:MAG: PIN domain-containing protein [Pyrinomonadaceae bacterium]
MGSLIDTSILVDAERGRIVLSDHVPADDDGFYISVVTASELWHGLHRAVKPGIRNQRAAFLEEMMDRFPMIPIDLPVARAHSRIWADLAIAGRMIGMNDLWLAATCIAHGLVMVTANVREFERVPGLSIDLWK